MSDDDEDFVATGRSRRSALNRQGRNRIRTLDDDSSDDEELFEMEEEEEVEDPDFSFSPENLKRAMVSPFCFFLLLSTSIAVSHVLYCSFPRVN
jgi:hypothetical protein